MEDVSQRHNQCARSVLMKELVCFAIGVVVGVVMMKKSQAINELKKELDREKCRNSTAFSAGQT